MVELRFWPSRNIWKVKMVLRKFSKLFSETVTKSEIFSARNWQQLFGNQKTKMNLKHEVHRKKNVSFCKLLRRGKFLEVLYLNSHLILSEYIALSRAAAVASKIYILFYLFFFCNCPAGEKFRGIIPGLFFEGKKNPSKLGGIFVKENKCYFLKVKPPISWGVFS